ncbi:MAG: hypothetical protein ACXABO_09205 [Promethearchaeota archaeon]|jgi:hypothetical protein
MLIFLGFGFLRKGLQSSAIIKRDFLLISAGAFIYIIGGVLGGLFPPGIYQIFVRAGMTLSG